MAKKNEERINFFYLTREEVEEYLAEMWRSDEEEESSSKANEKTKEKTDKKTKKTNEKDSREK